MLVPLVARDLFSQPLEIDKGMLKYSNIPIIFSDDSLSSQLSKFTHVVNNSSVMSGLFKSLKNMDFAGETNRLK